MDGRGWGGGAVRGRVRGQCWVAHHIPLHYLGLARPMLDISGLEQHFPGVWRVLPHSCSHVSRVVPLFMQETIAAIPHRSGCNFAFVRMTL